jgi:hypothetical protein
MRRYRHRTYPPATLAEIAAVEQKLGVTFCPDFKVFLQTDNGIEFEDDFDYSDYDDWIYMVREIFGISPQQKNNIQSTLEFDWFFDRRFLPICYPIGVDFDGNNLIQIAAGSRYGQLAMLDHEVSGGMRGLLDVTNGFSPHDDEEKNPLPFKTFAEATPDQILDECFKQGYLAHYPVSFAEHLENVDQLFNRLAEEYSNRPKVPVPTKAELKSPYLCLAIGGEWRTVEELSLAQGDRFIMEPGEALAWRYRVTMEETRELSVRVKYTGPEGRVLRDTIYTIESNATWQSLVSLKQDGVEPVSGVYAIEIAFPDEPGLQTLSDSREIVIGSRPLGFTSVQFKPASDEQIDALEARLTYRFCADFRHWLATFNGIILDWRHLALWNKLDDETEAAFEKEMSEVRKSRWELAVNKITGLQTSYEVECELGPQKRIVAERGLILALSSGLWGVPCLQMFYPIANAYGSWGYCQIAAGSRRGKIAELLLESPFLLRGLSDVIDGKRVVGRGKKAKVLEYPFKTFAEATPDEIIDAWVNEGLIRVTDMDFEEFSRRVIHAHEEEFERLFAKYIDNTGTDGD